jgi:oligoribonuclease (3'-5' exoribonuclease)
MFLDMFILAHDTMASIRPSKKILKDMSDWQVIMIGLSGGIQRVSHFIMSDFRLIIVEAKETINTLC